MPVSSPPRVNRSVLAIVVLGFALRVVLACADHEFIVRTGLFGDDAFYFLNIARHIAHGHGVTHDGVNPTNGIQPLYTFMLVPLFWLCGSNHVLPIHLAGVMLALFSTASGWFLYLLTRHLAGERGGLIALALWMFSAYVLRQTLNGMETGVSVFFLIVSTWWYVTRIRPADESREPTVATLLAGGCFLGLAILSRMDNVILTAVMVGDYVLAQRRDFASGLRRGVTFCSPAALALGGWLAVNVVTSGSLLPVSGRAMRQLSRLYAGAEKLAPSEDGAPRVAVPVRPAPTMVVWRRTVPEALVTFFNVRQWRQLAVQLTRHSFLMGGAAVAALFALVLAVSLSHGTGLGEELRAAWRRAGPIHWMLLYCFVLLCAYALYVFGSWFYPRYLFPKTIVSTLFLAVAYDAVVVRAWASVRPRVPRIAGPIAGVLIACQLAFGALYFLKTRAGFDAYYEAAQWLNRSSIDDATRIGAFQSGIIGYFARHTVIGLDGVVNEGAYHALRNGTLFEYLDRERIPVLVDDPLILERLCATDPEYDRVRESITPLHRNGFAVYRLPPASP